MYQIANIPSEKSRCQIKARVDGESIDIRCVDEPGTVGLGMTSLYVGDHMLGKPEALRQMIGDTICFAIRAGRDAGYAQAKAEIRRTLGLKD